MPNILQDFPIRAAPEAVYEALTQPAGLNCWWTETCVGEARSGEVYRLGFGPEFAWEAVLEACERPSYVAFRMTQCAPDWFGTRIIFDLVPDELGTSVCFAHRGWQEESAHFRTSAHCWALYLRLLRRRLEFGEFVPYHERLGA